MDFIQAEIERKVGNFAQKQNYLQFLESMNSRVQIKKETFREVNS